jgi:hypothetical protein
MNIHYKAFHFEITHTYYKEFFCICYLSYHKNEKKKEDIEEVSRMTYIS